MQLLTCSVDYIIKYMYYKQNKKQNQYLNE